MKFKNNILWWCRANNIYKGRNAFGTVHIIIVMSILLTLIASAATILSLNAQGAAAQIGASEHELEASNLFVYVDILVQDEIAKIYEEVQKSAGDTNSSDERGGSSKISSSDIKTKATKPLEENNPAPALPPKTDEEKKQFLKTFCTKLENLQSGINAGLSGDISDAVGLTAPVASTRIQYYDEGKRYFATVKNSDVESSRDIAIRVQINANNRQYPMSYAKYYYFNFDERIINNEMLDKDSDIISGDIFHDRR